MQYSVNQGGWTATRMAVGCAWPLATEAGMRQREPIEWPVPESVRSADWLRFRDVQANALAELGAEGILEGWLGHYPPWLVDQILGWADHRASDWRQGLGLELGAGCGLLSCRAAQSPTVSGILAVDVVPSAVHRMMPAVAARFGNAKVQPVLGSFDDLDLVTGSVDFVVEVDSLHHSDDLPHTVGEAARVLRRGGWLLAIDRCHPNSVTDEQVEEKLDRVYDQGQIESARYPPGTVLTRRDNGEHEYRQFEWEAAFDRSGLLIRHQIKTRRPISLSEVLRRRQSARLLRGWPRQVLDQVRGDFIAANRVSTCFLAQRR